MEDRTERGEGGIRTPDAGFTDITVFETAAFNHSATSPPTSLYTEPLLFNRPPSSSLLEGPAQPCTLHPTFGINLTHTGLDTVRWLSVILGAAKWLVT